MGRVGKYLWIFNGSREEKFLDRVGYLCASMIGVTIAAYENKIYRFKRGCCRFFVLKKMWILSICCFTLYNGIYEWANFIYKTWATCKQFFHSHHHSLSEKAMKMCFVFLWLSPNCHFRMCDVCVGINVVPYTYMPFYKWMGGLLNKFLYCRFTLTCGLWMWIINFNSNDLKCVCAHKKGKMGSMKNIWRHQIWFFYDGISPLLILFKVFWTWCKKKEKICCDWEIFYVRNTACDSHTINLKSITSLCH